jgi:signal transduction histidine kinase
MKLLQRTSLSYLLFSGLLLLAAGFLIYALLTSFLGEEITEKLIINKDRIVEQIEAGNPPLQLPPIIETEVWTGPAQEGIQVKDTFLFDPLEEESEIFREVTSIESVAGQTWRITLRQVIPEPHDYWNSIGLALSLVMLILLGGLLLINWRISRSIWKPFYQNLAALKAFSLESQAPLALHASNIREFRELNTALETLSEKIRADYHALREFTENASHEMQTPLAVLHSQLESALQAPDLNEKQASRLNSALQAARRLARLNQSLLLLAKIENRQFRQTKTIALRTALKESLEQFHPLIEAKNIVLRQSIDTDLTLHTDPALLEMLLSNLLSNAVRHNHEGGNLDIYLGPDTLRIANTGPELQVSPESLFARFAKGDPSSPSHGLGLAIVQKICTTCGWTVSYTFENNLHILEIGF